MSIIVQDWQGVGSRPTPQEEQGGRPHGLSRSSGDPERNFNPGAVRLFH